MFVDYRPLGGMPVLSRSFSTSSKGNEIDYNTPGSSRERPGIDKTGHENPSHGINATLMNLMGDCYAGLGKTKEVLAAYEKLKK